MNRNKRLAIAFLVTIFALVAVLGVGVRGASVANAQDDRIVCDWTLITMLYISEHVYGHFPMTDVSNFDFGQYTPLFEAMMAEMDAMTPTEEAAAMEPTEEVAMEPTEEVVSEFTQLSHGDIAGEPQACTDLRHELDMWFLAHFNMETEMGEG